MNQVFQQARDMQQATNHSEKTAADQAQTQSHILLTSFEEAVDHFAANHSEDLKLTQAKLRELYSLAHLCLEGQQELSTPDDSQS
ncbi:MULTISPECIES: hypothetical protein [Photobacterium]|uniref:Uncharacterized protein n=1 Tax=Photobacterium halotolerans TaxID=265726 RepID=A0A0F5VBF6_9GAMM|nr:MULTISPECIES: hypothetical protein [Photobacterium]KKC98824.1 hypothetical protein KY46_15925 [Photobacterium halotolerans]UIP30315.1 hypothetical protein LN341_16455 [Photobacterium sp. TLY01]